MFAWIFQRHDLFFCYNFCYSLFFLLFFSTGDILVSINGKNVIGIRRSAIERILKQYKVDQEIEIVVCRLKDPSFILNLSKLISNGTKNPIDKNPIDKKPISPHLLEATIAKYRLLNDQIFNELITFQDPTFITTTTQSPNKKMSGNGYHGHECLEDRYNNIEESRRDHSPKKYKSEKDLVPNPTFTDKNSFLISVPVKSPNESSDLNESLISIELPSKSTKRYSNESNSTSVSQKSVKYRSQTASAIRRPNTGKSRIQFKNQLKKESISI